MSVDLKPNGHSWPSEAAEPSRMEEPQCPWCGYLLVGLEVDRCPECGTVGAVSAAERGAPLVAMRKAKRVCVRAIVAAAVIAGVIDAYQPDLQLGGYVILIATYFATLTWCSADARERGSRYLIGEKLLVVFLPPAGLLWYLLTRRRFIVLTYVFALVVAIMFAYSTVFMSLHRLLWGEWPG